MNRSLVSTRDCLLVAAFYFSPHRLQSDLLVLLGQAKVL
jgi:hypothetical protein